ncbi:MAG: hypothetical protein RBR74_05450 [Ignavibacteriaceae bacterium]|nr:hypothetical protein [Ignavibacteriaceae bacterium]
MKALVLLILLSYAAIFLSSCMPDYMSISQDKNSPCYNKYLIQLEKKDSLSGDELKLYIALKQLCQEQKHQIAVENYMRDNSHIMSYFYYLSIVGLGTAIIYSIAK